MFAASRVLLVIPEPVPPAIADNTHSFGSVHCAEEVFKWMNSPRNRANHQPNTTTSPPSIDVPLADDGDFAVGVFPDDEEFFFRSSGVPSGHDPRQTVLKIIPCTAAHAIPASFRHRDRTHRGVILQSLKTLLIRTRCRASRWIAKPVRSPTLTSTSV